ncbi:MAG: hypothetical protein UT11_C0004G0016 [Berkelbacteria bacterium GW2011_GWA2_38_9]|uniref:Transcriptional repressor PaaX-like central Cas2-like domain-containing protein n=1 Tax=Berkelbacteria bacterium GW2011_GWA2_38_9 TaxID=1618334 RepID=A0A0G0NXA6_9BACT|nr:MAG: hypothetical protein UT11_C0004G0016 [Berkelbacteria bacterium GW2011_GWA2_38_9]
MKYSRLTYEVLKLLIEGTFQFATEIIEAGYLANKSQDFRERYELFKSYNPKTIKHRINEMTKLGLLEQIEDEYLLTKRGKLLYQKMDAFFLDLPKNIPWDGRFDILIFDIPQFRARERDFLRNILKRAGFLAFQKSVYVYPHATESEISKILDLFPDKQLVLLKRVISPQIAKSLIYRFKKNKTIK